MTMILVVEDNAVNRLAMQVLLRSFNLTCTMVENAREAEQAFRCERFALVLLDLMMPGIDGFQTARLLRTAEFGSGRRTPIVAVTAFDRELVERRCIDAGIDDILCKPIELAAIASQIAKWTLVKPVAAVRESDTANILETFFEVTRTLLTELEAAISEHDDDRTRRAIHELKGASLQVRAKEMARLCYELELAAHNDDRMEMVVVYAALAHAFERVKGAESKIAMLPALGADINPG
jgi:CheY-like chemotaxis protein